MKKKPLKSFKVKDLFYNKIFTIKANSEAQALKLCAKQYELNLNDLVLVSFELKGN